MFIFQFTSETNQSSRGAQWARILSVDILHELYDLQKNFHQPTRYQTVTIDWEKGRPPNRAADIIRTHPKHWSDVDKVDPAHIVIRSAFDVEDMATASITFALPSTINGLRAVPQAFWCQREKHRQGTSTPLCAAAHEACAAYKDLMLDHETRQTLSDLAQEPEDLEDPLRLRQVLSELVLSQVAARAEEIYESGLTPDTPWPVIAATSLPEHYDQLRLGFISTEGLKAVPSHCQLLVKKIGEATVPAYSVLDTNPTGFHPEGPYPDPCLQFLAATSSPAQPPSDSSRPSRTGTGWWMKLLCSS